MMEEIFSSSKQGFIWLAALITSIICTKQDTFHERVGEAEDKEEEEEEEKKQRHR